MEINEFWLLVEHARADAPAPGGLPTGTAVGTALTDRLAALSPPLITRSSTAASPQRSAALASGAICAASVLIWQHISDDGFHDFQAGLVGLGREAFERAMTEPDDLADDLTVQAIASGQVDKYALNGEMILYAASRAYERHTHDPDDLWGAVHAEPLPTDGDQPQAAEQWDGRSGSLTDRARIPHRLPRLSALFDKTAAH